MAIFMWWFMLGVIFMIIPGKKGINFYMCTGEDPRNDEYSYKKVSFYINNVQNHDMVTRNNKGMTLSLYYVMSSIRAAGLTVEDSFTY